MSHCANELQKLLALWYAATLPLETATENYQILCGKAQSQYNLPETQHNYTLYNEILESRHTNTRLSMLYKMINQQIIIPYNSYLQYSNVSFTRGTNCYKFIPFHCHKNTFQSSFFPPHCTQIEQITRPHCKFIIY